MLCVQSLYVDIISEIKHIAQLMPVFFYILKTGREFLSAPPKLRTVIPVYAC